MNNGRATRRPVEWLQFARPDLALREAGLAIVRNTGRKRKFVV